MFHFNCSGKIFRKIWKIRKMFQTNLFDLKGKKTELRM